MVVVTLATVILRIISSQSRLTHHQVSRIQAQYAAKAGVVYALEQLRKNTVAPWNSSGTINFKICRVAAGGCDMTDITFPASISEVDVVVQPLAVSSGPYGTREVKAKAIYTYTP